MITPGKIYQFLQGNLRWLGDTLNTLPSHLKEQVIWRMSICKDDCVHYGRCKFCSCELPGKLYVTESCNSGERFPDLMTEEKWTEYKIENNIILDI